MPRQVSSGGGAKGAWLLVICALLFCAAGAARGQSGRRQQKPVEVPPVPSAPVDPATLPRPTPPPQARLPLVVVSNNSFAISVSSFDLDAVQQIVLRRLSESNSLAPRGGDDNVHRGEAEKLAKQETEAYVVWVQLEANPLGGDSISMRRDDPENYQISFALLSPQTGKRKTSGSVQLRRYSNSRIPGIGRGSCYPATARSFDYSLLLGALEVAERVFQSLSVAAPPPCRG